MDQAPWSDEFHVKAKGYGMEKQDLSVRSGVPATLDRIVN
jgi:hypothetical protein